MPPPPTGKFLFRTVPPPHLASKILAFKLPLPLGISDDLSWGWYGFFLELHITLCQLHKITLGERGKCQTTFHAMELVHIALEIWGSIMTRMPTRRSGNLMLCVLEVLNGKFETLRDGKTIVFLCKPKTFQFKVVCFNFNFKVACF